MRPEPSNLPGLPDAFGALAGAFAAGLRPPPPMDINRWAREERFVSPESGSPYPGRWREDLVPYIRKIQECLSFAHPCREVTFLKSAQVAGTEIGVNVFGAMVCQEPCPILIVLPSTLEVTKYNQVKLQATIDASPALAKRVADTKSRDTDGSTTSFKRFAGGYCVVTGANSSLGLQMISARVIIFEEISGYPRDAGGRGDPIRQGENRAKAWDMRRPKRYYSGTPAEKGTCRITRRFEAGDRRRLYVPCPHCDHWFTFRFEDMRGPDGERGAHFIAPCCGCVVEHARKRAMVAAGVWIKCYPDESGENPVPDIVAPGDIARWRARPSGHRHPSFSIWQAYSNFVHWDSTWKEYEDSRDDPLAEKTFSQQCLGEAWQVTGEAPDFERLFERREVLPRGRIPPGGLFLTGAVDVQQNRLEWLVRAWGIGKESWVLDRGIVQGDTAAIEVWNGLAEIVQRRYPDCRDVDRPVEAWAIDSGYNSNMVYNFARRAAGLVGEGRVMAVKGMGDRLAPPLGTPTRQDVTWQGKRMRGGAMLWPVGTWALKAELYANFKKVVGHDLAAAAGEYPPGYIHFGEWLDKEFFRQATAETLVQHETRSGATWSEWVKMRDRPNEALDLLVYSAAAAVHLGIDRISAARWLELAAERNAPVERSRRQLDLWQQGNLAGDDAGGDAGRGGDGAVPRPVAPPADGDPDDNARRVARLLA